nr:TRIC cation channel family protein [Lysinibacillus fusiformis]
MFSCVGGGVIRDLLAGRTPHALREEIHAVLTNKIVVSVTKTTSKVCRSHILDTSISSTML